MATVTAYIFGTKRDIDNRSSALTTTRGLLHRPKMSWALVYKRLQTGPLFLPTACKFCFLHHCQALQMKISKQNSTKLYQTADGKSRLMVNISWKKRDRQSVGALESTKGLLHCPKISWTLVNKQVKIGPGFSSTLCKFCILLCCHVLHTEVSKQNKTELCQTEGGK